MLGNSLIMAIIFQMDQKYFPLNHFTLLIKQIWIMNKNIKYEWMSKVFGYFLHTSSPCNGFDVHMKLYQFENVKMDSQKYGTEWVDSWQMKRSQVLE